MSIVNLIFNRSAPTKLDDVELDVTISESHQYTNEITEYPIEDGSVISDHVRQRPVTLTIEGMTSNTPVDFFKGKLSAKYTGDETDRVNSMFVRLLALAGYGLPKQPGKDVVLYTPLIFDVVTGLRVYTDMIIKSISLPVNKDLGRHVLQYTIELTQIIKVKLQNTTVPVKLSVKTQAKINTNKGDVSKPAPLPETSLARQGANLLKSKLGL